MSPFPLYEQHEQAYCSQFANVEQAASTQDRVLMGAPGTIIEHKRGGAVYYARQYMGPEGRRQEESLGGPQGDPEVDARVEQVRRRIELGKDLIGRIRDLSKLGFQLADNKTYATVGVLYNYGLFEAGAVLVGSHAYAVILNSLGIRAVSYETEDIDIARRHQLALANPPQGGLLAMLKETGINFVPVPALKRGEPSTSYTEAGKSRFHVDLLVPSRDDTFPTVPVAELNAHATGLPYLAYLLGKAQTGTLISRHGAVPVRVPEPARFAIHKLLVSRLRTNTLVKSQKDVRQASVLLAMLGEHRTGDIEDACAELPRSARALVRRALPEVEALMREAHEAGLAELESGLAG
ncbi:GSU2403 family nucleotidyltransferase fold protein [Paraburkholderia phenoliruptrix]|uniref:GSU2403 family nucleotidyltransferase fold protein n=1 Tax=Paraburkholderia phenoliruptrix TaxID=252970 RepID=UPI002869BB51|nr:GSU2403 family nucleotidyltransferase fold protein [Paraburkholderia phenoliruptrix]WMY06704.1 GSU2403 family nucleotidyltransferase fold protein [Paraburkholderia phenoliruptrix]